MHSYQSLVHPEVKPQKNEEPWNRTLLLLSLLFRFDLVDTSNVWCYHYYMNTWRHCSHFNAELCTTIVIQFILIEDNLKIHRNTIQEIKILAKPHQRRGSSPESWASHNRLQGQGLAPLSSEVRVLLVLINISIVSTWQQRIIFPLDESPL